MVSTTAAKTVLVYGVLVIATGCAGSADDVCTRATQHLESCSGTTLPLPDTCDTQKASRILRSDCAALAVAGARSTSGFWDWLTGGAGDGAGGGAGGGAGNCMCDAQCAQYGDCCASCPNKQPGGGSGGQNKCFCDAQCAQYGDCCASCPAKTQWFHHCCIPISPIPQHQGDPAGCALSPPKELGEPCYCRGPQGNIKGKALGVCYPPSNELLPVDG